MQRRLIIILLVVAAAFPDMYGQGRKTIVNKKLESKTVHEYFIAEGRKEAVVELVEVYDARGNVIELKEFNSEGQIKSWHTYTFDEDDNKIEESVLNSKGKVVERTEWKYEDGLLVEKLYYDQKDRLVKRKEYKYELRKD